jgi:pilus assembly protein Flp/PilA
MSWTERGRKALADESGATAVEYALIVALIFLVVVGAVTAFANSANVMFGTINTAIGKSV